MTVNLPAIQSYLATRPSQLIIPNCFTVALQNGNKYYYTDADVDVVVTDTLLGTSWTFKAGTVLFTGIRYKCQIGLQVDEQTVKIAARPSDLIEGIPFLQAIREDVLVGAYITRDRAFLNAWNSVAIGSKTLFKGRFSTVDSVGMTEASIKVKSDIVALDPDFPRNIYAPNCRWDLFGYGCGLVKATFSHNGTVGIGSTESVIYWGSATVDKFDQGTVTFTSGVLDGEQATINHSTGSELDLAAPLTTAPATGDTFTATWGCDHTYGSGGCTKFANTAQFGGFITVPQVETGL